MTDPMEVIEALCNRYQRAVSANDSAAYGRLFAEDAIRVPPGGQPEHGADAIARSEQKDYDVAGWTIQSRPLNAMLINDDWIYGIAEADITLVAHADGAEKSLKANKTWLVSRQPSGQWLIKRQMWNYR